MCGGVAANVVLMVALSSSSIIPSQTYIKSPSFGDIIRRAEKVLFGPSCQWQLMFCGAGGSIAFEHRGRPPLSTYSINVAVRPNPSAADTRCRRRRAPSSCCEPVSPSRTLREGSNSCCANDVPSMATDSASVAPINSSNVGAISAIELTIGSSAPFIIPGPFQSIGTLTLWSYTFWRANACQTRD